jgi:hypothetical protein
MKKFLYATSLIGLLLTLLPPAAFAMNSLAEPTMKALMLIGMLLWFAAWPMALRVQRPHN